MIFNKVMGGKKAVVSYTGTHTTESYTQEGKSYTLYKITGSGTQTVEGKAKGVGIWLCGGGANGGSGGGAGAYCAQTFGTIAEGSYAVSVGARQGASSVGSLLSVAAVSGRNGGTGGGGVGTGDKLPKIPFGDETNFYKHCAGGGGGQTANHTSMGSPTHSTVGYGGSNGSNGGGSGSGIAGGDKGGGQGGSASAGPSQEPYASSGYDATFYGSGGGDGGYAYDLWNGTASGAGGKGYQGIVYIIVPV